MRFRDSPIHFFVCVSLLMAAPTRPAAQQPTFRSGVDLITVDVTVLDARGNPLADLAREEFALRVDGEPRRVAWSQFVPYGVNRSAADAPRPLHFSSNEHADSGRLVLVAVDQANIRRMEGRGALKAAGRFVDALHPTDRAAAIGILHTEAIHFTDDHARVKQTLDRLIGEQSAMPAIFGIGLSEALAISDGGKVILDQVVRRECGETLAALQNPARAAENEGVKDPCPIQVEQEARATAQYVRTQATLSVTALRQLIARLGEIDGPKVLVLLSEGLVAEPQLVDLTELGAAAQASRVTIYVLQLETPIVDAADDKISPTLFQDIQVRADGLARLAGSARGALFRLVGSDPAPFNRIMRELSGYYLLAFEPTSSDRDGRSHRIAVDVGRDRVTVRSRPAFKFTHGYDRRPVGASEERLVQVLRSSRFATELPIRVTTYAQQQRADQNVGVTISADTDGGGPDLTMGFVVIDRQGVIVTSASERTASGRHAFPVVLSPGSYVLRAAAVDATGRAGSIEHRFDAQLQKTGPLQVSDLLVAELGADGAVRPIVDRATGDRVRLQVELYGPAGLRVGQESVTLEIAREESSAALVTAPVVLARPSVGRWIVRADVSVEDLPRGRYVARAVIAVPGMEPQSVTRPFSKQ